MVFYDLTSTYFEGRGPVGLAGFGYSRDGKPRNRQVQVGLVMINGWPIAHQVFDGSLRDSASVEMVLKDSTRGRNHTLTSMISTGPTDSIFTRPCALGAKVGGAPCISNWVLRTMSN